MGNRLRIGIGAGEIILPQEYFEYINGDGTISYEDGFKGAVHHFAGARGTIKDSPMARVLLMEDGARAAIVSIEIAQSPADLVAAIQNIVSEICDVEENHVWVHTTHSFGFMHRPSDVAKADIFDKAMHRAVTEAAKKAAQSLQPTVLGVGTGTCHVSANKNIIAPKEIGGGPYYGPGSTLETNEVMTVVRFETPEGVPIGFFLSYGVKPSALCTTGKSVGNREVNSEVPGVACKLVEEAFGVPCMYCMPAAGDQYPRETAMYYGFDETGTWRVIDIGFEEGIRIVERLGAEMGADAIRIAKEIECTVADAEVRVASNSFVYPNKTEDREIEITIDAIALGDIAFVGFKQEMDCRTEEQIWAASPYSTTILVSFLNGDGKYLAHKEAFDFNNGVGTWEVARTAFAKGAAEMFVYEAKDLLNNIFKGVTIDAKARCRGAIQAPVRNVVEDYSKIRFGNHDWVVLDKKEGKILVISESVLEMRPYHGVDESVTWETCALRSYLNGPFYENTFSDLEKKRILETANPNRSNAKYATCGGNDTLDKVFLLSLEETELYLGGFRNLLVSKTLNTCEAVWWHLRSPGEASNVAASVSASGLIDYHGVADALAIPVGGVRPAMWLTVG